MRALGILLLGIGAIVLVMALNMDTTVETGGERIGYGEFSTYVPRSRVHNIGLMDERRNYMILGGLAAIMGVILIGFGSLANKTVVSQPKEPSGPRCPVCRGVIMSGCQVCQHCRTTLDWLGNKPMTREQAESRMVDEDIPLEWLEDKSRMLGSGDREAEKTRMEAAMHEREETYRQQEKERIELDQRQLEAGLAAMRERRRVVIQGIARFPCKCDALLLSLVGEENVILFHFARCLVVLLLAAAAVALAWNLLSAH